MIISAAEVVLVVEEVVLVAVSVVDKVVSGFGGVVGLGVVKTRTGFSSGTISP